MESGAIPDSSITASSSFDSRYLPHRARLNLKEMPSGWQSKTKGSGEWIQVDLGQVTYVTGIATQGAFNHNTEWMTSYSVQYSGDGKTFVDYQAGKSLPGNSDKYTVVKNDLQPAIIEQRDQDGNKRYLPRLTIPIYFRMSSVRQKND